MVLFSPLAFAQTAPAGLQINEIMYDLKTGSDSGREWVEVYNSSATPVDISKFVFFENDTNHKMTLKEGSPLIAAGGYAIIVDDYAKFKADWPSFNGNVFDSTFSLNNTGETIAIKNGNAVVDQYAYNSSQGGNGDGNSLQKINGNWTGAEPTPGEENKLSSMAPSPLPFKASATPSTSKSSSAPKTAGAKNVNPDIIPMPATLAATPPAGATVDGKGEHTDNSFFLIAILIIFAGFGAGALYSVLKNKAKVAPGEDFDILD